MMPEMMAQAQSSEAITWVGSWVFAPVEADAKKNFADQTIRQIIHTGAGGIRVRIRISNLFGSRFLRVDDAHIALHGSGSSIVTGTDRRLRFGGKSFLEVAPGAVAVSDPIDFQVPRLSDLAVSFYLPRPTGAHTCHPSTDQTNYIDKGDVSSNATLPHAQKTESNCLLTGIDIEGEHVRGAVVALGASITEGYIATRGATRSWPSVLAGRLADSGQNIAVLNEGISGNRLLADGAGPSALARVQGVLSLPGVRWMIFSDDPINDLGSTRPPPTTEALIAGLQQLVAEAHANHVEFFCSTLTTYEGASYWTPTGEAIREQFNAFLRSGRSNCDAVIDEDGATHDPAHPTRYLPVYDHGDHLHPNDAGHRAIADAIDLSLFLSGGREEK